MNKMILICTLSVLLGTDATAFVKPTDNIFDENENAIYMVGWVYSRIVSAQRAPGDTNHIYKINLVNNNREAFYDIPGATIDRLTLSPNSKYIAVLKGYTGWFGQQSELIILDKKDRNEILSFRDEIAIYKWNPDSNQIAYITGGDVEGRGFRSNGLWIYDLQKKEKVKIAEQANDVEWLPDGNIYVVVYERKSNKPRKGETVYNSFIYRYKTKTAEAVGIKGVKFSLDGKYSILLTRDYGDITADENSIRINFYDIAAANVIPANKLSNIFSEPSRIDWGSFTWLKGNRIVFEKTIANLLQRDILICDIEANKVLKHFNGSLVGTNSNRSKLVVFSNGKFESVNVP